MHNLLVLYEYWTDNLEKVIPYRVKKNAGKIPKTYGSSEISHMGILLFDLLYDGDWSRRLKTEEWILDLVNSDLFLNALFRQSLNTRK